MADRIAPRTGLRTLPAVLLAAACAGDARTAGPGSPEVVVDSAGIQLVTSDASGVVAWYSLDPAETLFEVGTDESDSTTLSHVRQALLLEDGGLAVVSGGDYAIRTLSPAGQQTGRIGRRGGGPGEFGGDPVIAIGPGDTIAAWDPVHHRLSWFSSNGSLLRETTLRSVVAASGIPVIAGGGSGWRLAAGGGFVLSVIGQAEVEPGSGNPLAARPLLIRASDGQVVHFGRVPYGETLTTTRADGMSIIIRRPFEPSVSAVIDPPRDRVVVSASAHWELREYSLSGDLRRIIRARVPRKPVTPAMKVQHEERTARSTRLSPSEVRRAVETLGMPDSLPAVASMLITGDGSLVVRHRAAPGDSVLHYSVVGIDGRLERTLAIADTTARLLDVNGERLVLARRGMFDVETINVLRATQAKHP